MNHPAHQHRSRKSRILQNTPPDQCRNFPRRRCFGKSPALHTARTRQFSLLMPTTQPVEFITADFYIERLHWNEARQSGDFILSREHHVGRADRIGKTKLLKFRETLGEGKRLVTVDPRIGDGLVKGNFRRPLRNGVITLTAFVQTDLNGNNFVKLIRGALNEKIGQAGRSAGIDERGATLLLKFPVVSQLFRFKRIVGEMRAEINVMRTQAQGGAQDDFIKDRRRSVDNQLAITSSAHDAVQVARVHLGYRNDRFLAEKAAGANRVAVTAPYDMALAFEELR